MLEGDTCMVSQLSEAYIKPLNITLLFEGMIAHLLAKM